MNSVGGGVQGAFRGAEIETVKRFAVLGGGVSGNVSRPSFSPGLAPPRSLPSAHAQHSRFPVESHGPAGTQVSGVCSPPWHTVSPVGQGTRTGVSGQRKFALRWADLPPPCESASSSCSRAVAEGQGHLRAPNGDPEHLEVSCEMLHGGTSVHFLGQRA